MADPITPLTAGAILTLAFQKFIESSVGEMAKHFTTEAIATMDKLRNQIWSKLRGKGGVEETKLSIERENRATLKEINQIAPILEAAMDEDAQFGAEIQALARHIEAGRLIDQSTMLQTNRDQSRG
jgi:hypothetical protein